MGSPAIVAAREQAMTIVHDGKFDGLFGEDGGHKPRRARTAEPLMAGLFGANSIILKQADRKSPAMRRVEPVDHKED